MRCEEFENRLNQLLDERESPEADESLRAHAGNCANCRRLLAGQEALLSGLEMFEAPALSAHFAERTVDSMSGTGATRPWNNFLGGSRPLRPWRTFVLVGSLAAAAVVLLAVGPAFWFAQRPAGGPGLAVVTPAPAAAPQAPAAPIAVAAPRAGEGAVPAGVLKPEEMIRELERLADDPPVWVNDVAGGLRPVAASMGEALQVLRQALPGKSEDARGNKPSAELIRPLAGQLV